MSRRPPSSASGRRLSDPAIFRPRRHAGPGSPRWPSVRQGWGQARHLLGLQAFQDPQEDPAKGTGRPPRGGRGIRARTAEDGPVASPTRPPDGSRGLFELQRGKPGGEEQVQNGIDRPRQALQVLKGARSPIGKESLNRPSGPGSGRRAAAGPAGADACRGEGGNRGGRCGASVPPSVGRTVPPLLGASMGKRCRKRPAFPPARPVPPAGIGVPSKGV